MPSENLSDLSTVTPEQLNNRGEEWGQKLREIKTNQIRNLYSAVQRIRAYADQPENKPEEINRRLIFLKPRLAYASARQERRQQERMKEFRDFLLQAIDGVLKSRDHQKALDNFFFLMESIVAYHKFHGGRDS